jgi:2-polyprenyl-3-methyl-5-hydroxy-6-metoxy-1,4-benzoquinol methylase
LGTLETYRASENEKARTADLLRLLPKGRRSVLDVGAREGYFSRLLTDYFDEVTALDLELPKFHFDRVKTVAGDATRLQFADDSFDCVFCAEVLEHIPDVRSACQEIVRVARHEIIIGVPFRQDTRIGRTTCQSCGKVNPPWGHVNTFDEQRLYRLFSGANVAAKSFVGVVKERTNPLSTFLMDLAGNPWGTYNQEEPCIYCGAHLIRPLATSVPRKLCLAIAARIKQVQEICVKPHGNWIHLVLSKPH